MSKALPHDLRIRVLTAVAGGLSHRQADERFGVSAPSVSHWKTRERDQGAAGLMPSDIKRLRQLEQENGKLKRTVADLTHSAPTEFLPISSRFGCPGPIVANSIRKKPKQASLRNMRATLQVLSARSGN